LILLKVLGIMVTVTLLYLLFPGLDLEVSSLFYDSEKGFYLYDNPLFYIPYHGMKPIVIVTLLLLFLLLAYQLIRKRRFKVLNPRAISFLLVFFLTGPILVTDTVLKKNWGRPKPVETRNFGGTEQYTDFFRPTGIKRRNGSFVSGHVAAAFFFVAFSYLYHSRMIFFLTMLFTLFVGLMRVMQGGHFLSDVLFAILINYMVLIAVFWLFYRKLPSLNNK